jgi:hypothetical protein
VFSAGTAEKELIHIRFVSHSPAFMVQIVEGRSHPTAYGDLITDRENYIARFTQNDVTDADIDFVRRTFGEVLPGRTTLVDEMTSTPLLDRVSVFDTDEMALRENWDGADVHGRARQHTRLQGTRRACALRACGRPP